MRIARFVKSLREARRHRIPLDRHNLRALWLQSEPDWQAKLWCGEYVTDEEFEAFMAAIK